MPFQSEKQRRYMHANLPELAQRWEQEYSNGGIARIPFALSSDTTAGNYADEVNEMMNIKTAFRPNTLLDTQIKNQQMYKDEGYPAPKLEKLKKMDMKQHEEEGTPLSLDRKLYTELPIGASNYMTDATWSGIGKNFSDLDFNFINEAGATTNDGITTEGLTEGLSTDVFESPTAVSGTDFGNTNFFGEPVVDEVVSRSFKDHDNFMSWWNANPQMGENITQKAKEFYEKGKSGINWAGKAAMTGIGKLIDFPLAALGQVTSFRNPLNPKSANYNRNLKDQINYLSGAIGTQSSPYQFRSGKGSSVLAGKNLVSGFGTNDYNKMLQKRIDYFNKFKEKRGLTIAQNKKLQDAIAEKKAADAAAAAANRRKVEQYTGRPMSDYRASRPASERQFTGHGKSGMGRSADRFA